LLLLVVIAFGVLGLALTGFRDGQRDRDLATQREAAIHYERGQVYLEVGWYQMAEAEFEAALRLAPNYADARDKLQTAQAEQTITPSPTPSPSSTPTSTPVVPTSTPAVVVLPVSQVLFEEGREHYANQEWDQAISKLEQLRAEDITFQADQVNEMLFDSYHSYGLELEQQDMVESAIRQYSRALDIRRDPEVETLRRRADLYRSALDVWSVNWESTVNYLTALHLLAPDYKDTADRLYQASIEYAEIVVRQERYCAAAELYEQALEIRGEDAEMAKLESDARHLCQVTTPVPLGTPTPNGSLYAQGQVHIGTLAATCYDSRKDQYNICAQTAKDNALQVWMTQAEQPALTLDGSWLAFRSTVPERPGLYAVPIVATTITSTLDVTDTISTTVYATGAVVTITTASSAHYPSWSPDSTRIAYTQYSAESEGWFIYLAEVGTGELPRQIREGEWPDWGPGGWLAFSTCSGENNCGIHVFNPDTWELRKLTASKQDRAPAWSPSGDEIAYMSDIGVSLNLYVVHTASGNVRQITRNLFTDGMPVWSPDGQRVAFVSDRNDDWSVYTTHPYPGVRQTRWIAALGAESADWQRAQLSWVAPAIRLPDVRDPT
jgi:tetratricopeptide (TPR) repeat protein